MGSFRSRLCFLAVFILLALPVYAQVTSVSGKITDAAGAVIPGVTVTLTSSTGATRTAVSDDIGVYQFLQLKPGTYQIKAELSGFKTAIKEKVELLVDTPSTVDLQMQVGEIAQTVTVEAGTSKLNTTDGTLGNAITGNQIRELPLESRNVAALLTVQPAVTPSGYVAGARSDQSNITLDGIDINDQQIGDFIINPSGTAVSLNTAGNVINSVIRVNPDSVQEFRVTTATPTATQGRSSGGQVSLVSRTGTNDWHGSLYEYHRNTVTSANDFFNNRVGVDRPKLLRNVFGGSVGGPIKKDRAFFFYNYEGRRDAKGTSLIRTVPLASMGLGQLKYRNKAGGTTTLSTAELNALYPAVGMNPIAIKIFADAATRYPANDTSAGDGLNYSGFRFNAGLPVKQNAHTATLLFHLTEDGRHTLFVRGNYTHDLSALQAQQFPDTPTPSLWNHPIGVTTQHNWTVNPRIVNTFRYGLTREAFSQQGDSAENNISFRFIYSPKSFVRTLTRTTPVHNFVDDFSWVSGRHTWQFGTNIRLVRNSRTSFSKSYDSAITNPSFYASSGGVVLAPITDISGNASTVRNTVTALIGRYSQYSGNFNFGPGGSVLAAGDGVLRTFATEEYEFYTQDSWRVRPDLTLTLGLRYGVSTPVYETHGLEVKPNVSLGDFFEQRKISAAQGIPYDKAFSVDLAGPKNGKPGFYDTDKNNFAPRAAFAWSPSFDSSLLRTIFGTAGKSVIRGGFATLYDRVGSQLAVTFDLNNTLGFSSTQTIAANTYNVTTRPAPLFTGFNQAVRTLPGITIPSSLTFPLTTPSDERRRIESSLDDTIKTPIQYSWNLSIGREFAHGLTLEAAYIGRAARHLLATRDIMAPNNLVDPASKMDWYTAASLLYDLRANSTPIAQVQAIPYFQNLFPDTTKLRAAIEDYYGGKLPAGNLSSTQMVYIAVARPSVTGFNVGAADYTTLQDAIDDAGVRQHLFYQPQYGALSVFSSVADSDYHAGTLSIREHFKNQLTMDFNYTFSKSIDTASGLETGGTYGSPFILNPLRPHDNRGLSDFDIKHIVNSSALWEIPVGRSRSYLNGINPILNGVIGGWQLTGIFRWNTGLPISTPFDAEVWATNWNVQSNGTRIRPLETAPTKGGVAPNIFSDPQFAYNSFRNAKPGETGERNTMRQQGFVALDFGLDKSFKIYENHTLQFRWEVFNATNTQRLGQLLGGRSGYGLQVDSVIGTAPPEFGRYQGIQGTPRAMQFALRYDF
ncbi:MAG TPA: TonB-dependent receptor [Acidobacteriota bacterium]